MNRIALSLLLATLPCAALATKAYRWTDAQGVVHIQDQPHEGAEEIELGSVQTYKAPPVPSTPSVATPAQPAGSSYQSCNIAQPANDAVLWEQNAVTVSVQVQPALTGDDQLWLSFDGRSIAPQSPGGTSFVISPIDRGTHTVSATVRSATGTPLCSGAASTFHVRQPSVLSPQSPQRAR